MLRMPQIAYFDEYLFAIVHQPAGAVQETDSVRVAFARAGNLRAQRRIDVFQIAVVSGIDRSSGVQEISE